MTPEEDKSLDEELVWEARVESMRCACERRTGDKRYPILCTRDGQYITEAECLSCKGLTPPTGKMTDAELAMHWRTLALAEREARLNG